MKERVQSVSEEIVEKSVGDIVLLLISLEQKGWCKEKKERDQAID